MLSKKSVVSKKKPQKKTKSKKVIKIPTAESHWAYTRPNEFYPVETSDQDRIGFIENLQHTLNNTSRTSKHKISDSKTSLKYASSSDTLVGSTTSEDRVAEKDYFVSAIASSHQKTLDALNQVQCKQKLERAIMQNKSDSILKNLSDQVEQLALRVETEKRALKESKLVQEIYKSHPSMTKKKSALKPALKKAPSLIVPKSPDPENSTSCEDQDHNEFTYVLPEFVPESEELDLSLNKMDRCIKDFVDNVHDKDYIFSTLYAETGLSEQEKAEIASVNETLLHKIIDLMSLYNDCVAKIKL